MHTVPKSGHSGGWIDPIRTSPHRASSGSATVICGASNLTSASQAAYAGASPCAESGIDPSPRHSKWGRTTKVSASARCAARLPSHVTARPYWFSTVAVPALIWRSSIVIDCSRSSGSNPDTATGRPYSSAMNVYGAHPTTVETWPGPINASIRQSGASRSARSAGNRTTWLLMTEKFSIPSARACINVSAVDGLVVSKPMAKKRTSRPGSSRASFRASSGE